MLDVTMLMPHQPFGEWVTVYYDPGKIEKKTRLNLLKEKRCPRAALVREEGTSATVMNPIVAAGNAVHVRIDADHRDDLHGMTLPDGWKLVGGDDELQKKSDLVIQVPAKAEEGDAELDVRFGDRSVKVKVTVVKKV